MAFRSPHAQFSRLRRAPFPRGLAESFARVLGALVLLLLAALAAAGGPAAPRQGPGLGNARYAPGEVFHPISRIDADNGAPRAHGTVAMHNGYLVVIYSNDGSEGSQGGFSFYDVSDPRSPRLVARKDDAETRDIREAHGFGFSSSYGADLVALQAARGVQIWDWSDVSRPRQVSYLRLPGITDSEYSTGALWLFWQAPYIFVGGTSNGLYVVDARAPAHPRLLTRMPMGKLGGFRVGPVFAVGNLLVCSAMDQSGYATIDISDPRRPALIAAKTRGVRGTYSTMFNGGRILGAGVDDRFYVHDVSDPRRIRKVNQIDTAGRGGYVTFQDGFAHVGVSDEYAKIDVREDEAYRIVGTGKTGIYESDHDFVTVLGNLVFIGNDHPRGTLGIDTQGSVIMPHQAEPDTRGPAVNMVAPAPNAVRQALTTRVGLTLTDQVDLRSVDARSFIVRPVGGAALPGRYSVQTGIVNWCPDALLQPDTVYEIVVPAGGIRDYAGNAIARGVISRFSTGPRIASPLTCEVAPAAPARVGGKARLRAVAAGRGELRYTWDFGDDSDPVGPTADAEVSHVYIEPGHYVVRVTVENDRESAAASCTQTIYSPPTPRAPSVSTTIAYDPARERLWVVNTDSGSVGCVDARTNRMLFERAVGGAPRTLALAPDGSVWVVCQGDATVVVVDGARGTVLGRVPLPRASRPYGIAFDPGGGSAYVTLQALARLVRIDARTGKPTGAVVVGLEPHGVAVTADGKRLFVSRFISPEDHGEITEVDAAAFRVTRRLTLAADTTPDSQENGRGIPNYVGALAISPDGARGWVPSAKANTLRGELRDGQALTFESTVRAIVSQIDLRTSQEDLEARRDLNNHEGAAAVCFSPLGDYVFVALQGSNAVDVLDAYDGRLVTSIERVGRTPQGLAISPDGSRLYVQCFLSRSVQVYNVRGITGATDGRARAVAGVRTVAAEPLPPRVLRGKQIFYNAADPRMCRDGYLSCASCHLDGDGDGRVWDFTDRGEGLRNTIPLIGRRGMAEGRLHWSANFDEVQDFEDTIRRSFSGRGFMPDRLYRAGSRSTPLGDPKAGLSPSLDALAAYVTSLRRVNPSPFRRADGALTPDGEAGRTLFVRLGCGACHSGRDFTDSASGALHDVGTLKPSSGRRLGGPLAGIDTPTLKGVWESAPYLHDGSAPTLLHVLTTADPLGRHSPAGQLSAAELRQMVDYLRQIDDSEPAPEGLRR
jgi:DNA-binding beta-propeller fold protein YncE